MTKDEIIMALLKCMNLARQSLVKAHFEMAMHIETCQGAKDAEWAVHGVDDCLSKIMPELVTDENLRRAMHRLYPPIGEYAKRQ